MSFNCVIFDFNGTLFWDTHLHNRAWDLFLENHDITITDEEKNRILHGKHNQEILKMLFGSNLSDDLVRDYILEKEKIYQQMAADIQLKLAPGVEDFLDFLTGKRIVFTIATASGIENVRFYFEYLGLARWFDYSKVVYNNGTIKSKPDPEIFTTAMKIMNAVPARTVIFEDSETGIRAALAAKPGMVVHINSINAETLPSGIRSLTHFNQVPRKIFC
jgi:HAD superfamily hydrolase (TIGR01509 family)